MLIKDYYGQGLCPECHNEIPDDAKVGDQCGCGNHTFINTFKKITIGYVVQEYETQEDGSHVCIEQEFIAGEVQYDSTEYGDGLDNVDTDKEVYIGFDMVQPKPSTKGLQFICPNCEDTKLQCCMDDGNSSIVTVIHEDGQFEYDGDPTDGDLSHYQCDCCGMRLMNDIDLEIQDDEEIVEWIKKNCSSINKVKLAYEDGVCPDCDTGIPDDVADGQCCANCTHVFYYDRPDDG